MQFQPHQAVKQYHVYTISDNRGKIKYVGMSSRLKRFKDHVDAARLYLRTGAISSKSNRRLIEWMAGEMRARRSIHREILFFWTNKTTCQEIERMVINNLGLANLLNIHPGGTGKGYHMPNCFRYKISAAKGGGIVEVMDKHGVLVGMYETPAVAAEALHLSTRLIGLCLEGKRRTHKGYTFGRVHS